MKIAYFLDIASGIGGAGNVLLNQAYIMSKFHDVIVVIPCSEKGEINSEYERRCRQAALSYKGIYYNTAFYLQYIDLITARQVQEEIKKFVLREKIKFLHSVQLNIAVELVSRELGIPHLMNAYSLRKEEFVLDCKDILPKYHSCDSFLYCKLWSEEAGMETECIRPSAPLNKIKEKRKENKEIRLLMLGDICKYKNQLTAIQAVEVCRKCGEKIFLTIVGNDDSCYAEVCKSYINKKKLSDIVNVIGFQNNVEPFLNSHDCLICSSERESFPCSIVEAMTYDLTIISTPVAGVPELLVNEKNAFISSGFGLEEIVASIIECIKAYQDGSIKIIHRCARDTWKKNFSRNVVRKNLDKYYTHIIKEYYTTKKCQVKTDIFFENVTVLHNKLVKAGMTETFVLQRSCYYEYLKRNLQAGKAYIWGAGKYGAIAKRLLKLLLGSIELIAYIDKEKSGTYMGISVITPDEVKENVDYIFLAFAGEKEHVIEYLENKGYEYNKSIWILP